MKFLAAVMFWFAALVGVIALGGIALLVGGARVVDRFLHKEKR